MEVLSSSQIVELARYRQQPALSFYVGGSSVDQPWFELRRLLNGAQARLAGTPAAQTLAPSLDRARRLAEDSELWKYHGCGVAAFCGERLCHLYPVPDRVPTGYWLGNRFWLMPLLPFLQHRFFLLALCIHRVRLFQATPYSMDVLDLPDLPRDLERVLDWRPTDGRQRALHNGSSSAALAATEIEAASPVRGERYKRQIQQYLAQVDGIVSHTLRYEQSPLILASVGYIADLYRSSNSYPHLVLDKVPGDPDRWAEDELRHRAWRLVQWWFRQRYEQQCEAVQKAASEGRVARECGAAVEAAEQGRVQLLFVRHGLVEQLAEKIPAANDDGMTLRQALESAAVATIAHQGHVCLSPSLTLPQPAKASDLLLAVLRS